MSKEVFKIIVKRVVDKVLNLMEGCCVFKLKVKIDKYIDSLWDKLIKFVMVRKYLSYGIIFLQFIKYRIRFIVVFYFFCWQGYVDKYVKVQRIM